MYNPNTLGNYLREKRFQAGITLKTLSLETKIDASRLSNIELGAIPSPPMHILDKIGKYYGISAVELTRMIDLPTIKTLAYLHFYEEHEYVSK